MPQPLNTLHRHARQALNQVAWVIEDTLYAHHDLSPRILDALKKAQRDIARVTAEFYAWDYPVGTTHQDDD